MKAGFPRLGKGVTRNEDPRLPAGIPGYVDQQGWLTASCLLACGPTPAPVG